MIKLRLAFGVVIAATIMLPIWMVAIVSGVVRVVLQGLALPFSWLQEKCAEVLQPPQ